MKKYSLFREEIEPLHMKKHSSINAIAKKHKVSVKHIVAQLTKGIEVEHEHTNNHDMARDIALNHLEEIPDYYTRLSKMEKSALHEVYQDEHGEDFDDFIEKKRRNTAHFEPGQSFNRAQEYYSEKNVEHHHPYLQNLEEPLKKSLKQHSVDSSTLNAHLLGMPIKMNDYFFHKELVPRKEHLDKLLNSPDAKTNGPITTYSGIKEKFANALMGKGVGATVHFPAYTSTSVKPDIAHGFSSYVRHPIIGQQKHVLVFHLPEGYHKGKFIAPHSNFRSEREFLLGRNQKFKITKRTKPAYGYIYHHLEPIEDKLEEYYSIKGMPTKKYDDVKSSFVDDTINHKFYSNTQNLINKTREQLKAFLDKGQLNHHRENLEKNNTEHQDWLHQNFVKELTRYTQGSSGINLKLVDDHIARKPIDYTEHRPFVSLSERFLVHPTNALKNKLTVYSGLGRIMGGKMKDARPGDTLHNPAYTSASISFPVAKSFAISQDTEALPDYRDMHDGMHTFKHYNSPYMAAFHLPKGYHGGMYINSHSHYGFASHEWKDQPASHEHEFLLEKGQKFKFVGKSYLNADGHNLFHIHHFIPLDYHHK